LSFAKRIKIASPARPRAMARMARGCEMSDCEANAARRRRETMRPLERWFPWAT